MKRFRFLLAASSITSVVTAIIVACEPAPAPQKAPLDTRNAGDDDTTKKNPGDDDTVVTKKTEADPPLPDGGKPPGRVYAHTATGLYLFDPLIKTLTFIGDFKGLKTFTTDERMLDIALDATSQMYGTTDHGFVKIDPTSAQVTYVKSVDDAFTFPVALTFVPSGTVDPTKEALVGYVQGANAFGPTQYTRIDLATGVMSNIGELNDPTTTIQWKSSGDIIAMSRNGTAFITVKVFSPDGGTFTDPGTDSLAQIDPKTGKILKIIGDIGQPNFYGLGQWAGTAYGFNAGGNIVEINLTTGQGTTILTLHEDGGAVGSWFGAGVTTDSPTKP